MYEYMSVSMDALNDGDVRVGVARAARAVIVAEATGAAAEATARTSEASTAEHLPHAYSNQTTSEYRMSDE